MNSNGETEKATVTKRVKDNKGKAISKKNANLLLNTRKYECTLVDDSIYRYNANLIADNSYSKCDAKESRHAVLQEIINHKKDSTSVDITGGFTLTKHRKQIPKKALSDGYYSVSGVTDCSIGLTSNI